MSTAGDEWYYAKGSEKLGPVPGSKIRTLVASGELSRESLVWKSGMAEWQAYDEIEASVPGEIVEAPVGSPSEERREMLPIPNDLKRTNFTKVLILGGICIALYMLMIAAVVLTIRPTSGSPSGTASSMMIVMAVMGIGTVVIYGLGIYALVLCMIYVFRAWRALQPFGASVTPGMAVGLQFVPFFNVYWNFRAYRDWAHDYNRILASDERFTIGPRAKVGLFVTYCWGIVLYFVAAFASIITEREAFLAIGGLAAVVSMICYLIVLYQMCNAVNFFIELRDREAQFGAIPLRSESHGGQADPG